MTLTTSSVTTTLDTTLTTAVAPFVLSPSKGQGAISSRRYRKRQVPVPVDLRVILRWTGSSVHRDLGQLDPVPFWTGFRQLLRCHYLLWQTGGIAKPEISSTNLLYDDLPEGKRAVMIDFDVAVSSEATAPQSDSAVTAKEQSTKSTTKVDSAIKSKAEVDSASKSTPEAKTTSTSPAPQVQASVTTAVKDTTSNIKSARSIPERMPGAMVYMPHEIIDPEAFKSPISRQYRHDLESFTWYLTFQCLTTPDRERLLDSSLRHLAWLRKEEWTGRRYGRRPQYPYPDIPFDKDKWGCRMEFLVKRLLMFWSEEVSSAIQLGRLQKELTKGDDGESRKDPFAEIASGPFLGGLKNEEEEIKWIVEKFSAILRETGLPLGFEFADLDSANLLLPVQSGKLDDSWMTDRRP